MSEQTPKERFESALLQPEPMRSLYELAQDLKRDGMTQLAMYHLYDEFRARNYDDADERIYDAILETMDAIIGWSHRELFDQELDRSLYDEAFMKKNGQSDDVALE